MRLKGRTYGHSVETNAWVTTRLKYRVLARLSSRQGFNKVANIQGPGREGPKIFRETIAWGKVLSEVESIREENSYWVQISRIICGERASGCRCRYTHVWRLLVGKHFGTLHVGQSVRCRKLLITLRGLGWDYFDPDANLCACPFSRIHSYATKDVLIESIVLQDWGIIHANVPETWKINRWIQDSCFSSITIQDSAFILSSFIESIFLYCDGSKFVKALCKGFIICCFVATRANTNNAAKKRHRVL